MASVVDLSFPAHLSYLSAHAFATADGILCESRSGKSGLCSGRDFKTVGTFGVARGVDSECAFARILRDVLAMICRARRVLEFAAIAEMGVAGR